MSYILVLCLCLVAGAFADEEVDIRKERCKTLGDEWNFNSFSPPCISVCVKRVLWLIPYPNAQVMPDDTPCKVPITKQDGVCMLSVCLDPAVAESIKNLRDKAGEEASKIAKDLSNAVNGLKEGGGDLINKSMDAAKKYIESLVDQARAKANE